MARRDTRELILQTSLVLFNEWGEPRVTTNLIADEADISPGNLYYHFKSKHDIVVELFKRFLVHFDPIIDVPESSVLDAEDLWFQLHLSFELKGHFRFLYRNMADIASRIPDLEKAFRGLLLRERQAASAIISSLQKRSVLHISPQEKTLLLNNLMLNLTYWIPFAEMFKGRNTDGGDHQVEAIAAVLQMLVPYLAKAEQEEYSSLISTYLMHGK
jgi:AcrR family transcriptional regulator